MIESKGFRRAAGTALLLLFAAACAAPPLVSTPTPEPAAGATAEPARAPAFPGAVGFGAITPGGRGGRVIYVEHLDDAGPGSLRAALEAEGPRIVVVNVSGTITLTEDIRIRSPYISIYGNKAPGGGIQLRRGMIVIATHDVVIRYLKVRPGDEPSPGSNLSDRDAITAACGRDGSSPYNIIIDHSSLVWGTDIGGFAATCGAHDITVQASILGEGINEGGHADGSHSKGLNLAFDKRSAGPAYNITLYRNLITTSSERMPQFRSAGRVDFVNNVIYNWGRVAGEGASSGLNLIGNTWRRGPLSKADCAFKPNPADDGSNIGPIFFDGERVDEAMAVLCDGLERTDAPYPLSIPPGLILPADDAYRTIVVEGDVGAILPIRDAVDARLIQNVEARAGGLINSPFDVGGWPDLSGGRPAADADADGTPDDWELRFGFDLDLAGDGSQDADADGYTNVEEYLNDTPPIRLVGDAQSAKAPTPEAPVALILTGAAIAVALFIGAALLAAWLRQRQRR